MRVVAGWTIVLLVIVTVGVWVEAGIGVGVSHTSGATRSRPVEFEVFVDPTATMDQIAAIRTFLDGSREVASCTYLDHAQSYSLMKQLFANDPSIWEAVTPADTPTVFTCTLRGSSTAQFRRRLESLAAIYTVTPPVGTGFVSGP